MLYLQEFANQNDDFLFQKILKPNVLLYLSISRKRQAKMQKELEDAAKDTRPSSPDRVSLKETLCLPSSVPTKVSFKFVR